MMDLLQIRFMTSKFNISGILPWRWRNHRDVGPLTSLVQRSIIKLLHNICEKVKESVPLKEHVGCSLSLVGKLIMIIMHMMENRLDLHVHE